jgi:dTDP-4-dehydrorhamnose 3,5-epimerase
MNELDLEFKKLKRFDDERGYLIEGLRVDDKMFDGEFGQCLVSVVYPGVIKGLHLHHQQIDYTCCIKGNLRYVAVKEKEDGEIESRVLTIGDNNPLLIKVPAGLWHGYMAVDEEAVILHVMNKAHDSKNKDTDERDPFYFGNLWK